MVAGAGDQPDTLFLEALEKRRQAADVEFDAVVIGTGFAGAVTACRLVEAGFKVCILERGRRYGAEDFPRFPTEDLFVSEDAKTQFAPPPDFSRWLWSQDGGLYDVRDLADTVAVQAAGYGGGSLIYANVHLRPPHDVFKEGWPDPYSGQQLEPYFDLAAYMLGAAPVPQRLAKTLQLRRAAAAAEPLAEPEATPASWFRTPLAINFTHTGRNRHGRDQNPCDMRARCWRGCDRQAKNTLDLNYLAEAENGGCDIRTMAEVRSIGARGKAYEVRYLDLLRRRSPAILRGDDTTTPVGALYVFLCAGAVNTTELLFRSRASLWGDEASDVARALGSHYSPNSDTLSAVFDCDEPHEADYGPTVTSAVLYDQVAKGEFSCTIEFTSGHLTNDHKEPPIAGTKVTSGSRGTAILAHQPVLNWGSWKPDDHADGTLVLYDIKGDFRPGDSLTFQTEGVEHARAEARSKLIEQRDWFLVEDGGYPRDIEELVGAFRSPLWLRRNRYLETAVATAADVPPRASRQATPLRRPPTRELRFGGLAEAIGGTGTRAFDPNGAVPRTYATSRSLADTETHGRQRELLLPGALTEPLTSILPDFFVNALKNDRAELLAQAAAFALPMLSRMLDDLSTSVASQIDPDTRERFSPDQFSERQVGVLVRGLMRQVLQILAGSEVTLAENAARALLNPVPETPQQLLNVLASALLWAIGYDTNEGHTALLFTMGRDTYRGRLVWKQEQQQGVVHATLPTRVLDSASATHERVLREIALAWRGELRTNPGWTTLGTRVTVHSQGGCPMGERGRAVTDCTGQVYDCDGLYVMDAAAFPRSVGVNPSATIAAVAEYKVEQFIRTIRPEWRASDHDAAADWVAHHGRAAIDPLNSGLVRSRPEPSDEVNVLGLTFKEVMQGFCAPFRDGASSIDFADLSAFPTDVTPLVEAEGRAIANGEPPITVCLNVAVPDLARLVSGNRGLNPPKLKVGGHVRFAATARSETDGQFQIQEEESFLQLFVRPTSNERRFFHYHLEYRAGEQTYRLDGVKVLCDAPGFDAWHDTSSLYCELTSPKGRLRGVLRLSIETFVRHQLPSFDITGTNDPARKSWALLAFYKYFAGELIDIYMKRLETFKDTFIKLVTSIHV